MADSTMSVSNASSIPTMPTNTTSGLSDVFRNQINYVLAYEQQPLDRVKADRDALNLTRTAYTEMSTKLTALQSATRALMSTYGSSMAFSRSVLVTPGTANTTVASATAGSAAVMGTYNLSVTTLAASFIHTSAEQTGVTYATDALGKSGNFIVGGDGTTSATETSDTGDNVTSVSTSAVNSSFSELGRDVYTVETRNNSGTIQFRIRDADGNVVSVADKATGGTTLTADWQTLTAGAYDTKRGLTIDFTGTGTAGQSATVDYKPAGTTISVDTTDSLISIANKINSTTQADGREIQATVIGRKLVLTGPTGENNQITYTDGVGLGLAQTQAGANAVFSINNVSLSRQSNTDITDAVNGLSLSLASDAQGKSATLVVGQDTTGGRATIEAFITAYNDAVDYINEKSAITQGDNNTYTRGALANETTFQDLKSSLFENMLGMYSNSGAFSMMSEIGISFDDDLKLTITDSTKLDDALQNNYSDVTKLFDSAMGNIDPLLTNYTGASGYISTSTTSLTSQYIEMSNTIQDWQVRLINRKSDLETQYANMQQQLLEMQYSFKTWQGMYSNTVAMTG